MFHRITLYSNLRYNSGLCVMLFFVVFLFVLTGCQEESEEITWPPPDEVIAPNSQVKKLIQRIAFHDGSSDNILDYSNCSSVVLPVSVVVNGQQITINSEDDLKTVERIFDEMENDEDTLSIIFPITVILKDHDQLIINNQEELEEIIDQCTESGDDDDIECIDFKYSLTFSVYDSDNQLSEVITIEDDQQLFEFFKDLDSDLLVGFKFPITIVLSNGEEIAINDNDQLEDIVENAIDDCDEDDDNDYNDDDIDDSGLNAVLIVGEWKISSFIEETDKTSEFASIRFTFNADGSALADDGESITGGIWESYGDNGILELELDFGEEIPFEDIMKEWELTDYNNSVIKLKHTSEENELLSILVFEKI